MESNEVKRVIRLALTENPDKRITPKELEDAMIKTVDYVDETKTSLEKYVDEKLADVPDVPETPETPETPDAPGCECEPVEKKDPYVIVVEDIFNATIINNEEEVNKVREALTDGSGVLVKFTDNIHAGDLFIRGYETKDDNSLYATRRIDGRKHNIGCKWDVKLSVLIHQVTISCNLVYFNYRHGVANGYMDLQNLLSNMFSKEARGDLYGPIPINGETNLYTVEIDNVSYASSNVYLSGKILNLDYGRNITITINNRGGVSALVDLPYTENPVKKEELYFNDGSDKVVPIRHPDLSTQPSILPYKFAGNYVYEQMFYISEPVNTDSHFVTIPLTMDELSAGELPVILDCNISAELEWNHGTVKWTKHVTNCNTRISFSESRGYILELEFLKEAEEWESGSMIFVNAWVRLVWSKKPKNSGEEYYYQQQEQIVSLELILSGSGTTGESGYFARFTYGLDTIKFPLIEGENASIYPYVIRDWIHNLCTLSFANGSGTGIAVLREPLLNEKFNDPTAAGQISWDMFKNAMPYTTEHLLNGSSVILNVETV